MVDSVGKKPLGHSRDPISIWNISIPFDVDRLEYIKTCFLTGTVVVANENGELKKARIGKLAIQLVNFPLEAGAFGSTVSCLTSPYSGMLFVADVYTNSNEFHDQNENQYRFVKRTVDGYAEIKIDGTGNILLTVDSELADGGVITLNVTNKDRAGKLNINVNGDVTLMNDGNVTVKTSTRVLLDSPKILLNESDEPVLLGTKTVKLLEDILKQLEKESAGPYPLIGRSIYTEIKEGLEDLKSTISFVK